MIFFARRGLGDKAPKVRAFSQSRADGLYALWIEPGKTARTILFRTGDWFNYGGTDDRVRTRTTIPLTATQILQVVKFLLEARADLIDGEK